MSENENLWRSMSLDQDLSIENAQDFLVCLVWGFFSPPRSKFHLPRHPDCLSELAGTETVSQRCCEV